MDFIFKSKEAEELLNKVKADSAKRKSGSKKSNRQVSDAMAHAMAELDGIKRVDIEFIKDSKSLEDRATPRRSSAPTKKEKVINTYIRENDFMWHRKDFVDPRTGKSVRMSTRLVLKYVRDLKEFGHVEVTLTTRQGTQIPY